MKLLMRLPPVCAGLLLAVLTSAPVLAQATGGTVRGVVTDQESKRPLGSVTVTYGGQAAVSRADGHYVITNARAGTDSLRARNIGFQPYVAEVTVAAGEVVTHDITLAAQAVKLSEMVVVGYGEQRAADITGAVTNVTADEFNTGRIVTPTELIQNKVAGVQVVESNEPGGGTSIRIRGPSSTTASSEPLYVVDGVPLGTGSGTGVSGGRDPLNFLNSADIESITVLRDASAAAIYGTNAANGVVLITTKRGRPGAGPQFEYSGSVSASKVTRLPSMLNAAQFRDAVTQYAPQNVGEVGTANTDWFGQVDRTGFGQEHNFAMSGAGNASSYRISASYLDQKGIIDKTQTQRVTLGLNYNQRLAQDRLNLRFSVRGSRAEDQYTPGGVLSNAAQMGPTQPVKDTLSESGYFEYSAGELTTPDNPVAILRLSDDQSTTYRSVGNMQATYDLKWINGLSANLNLGYDVTKADREQFSPSTLHRQQVTDEGTLTRFSNNQLNSVAEAYLHYAAPRPVGPGILDLTGGYSYSSSHGEFPYFQAKGLSTDVLGDGGIPSSASTTNLLTIEDSKLISVFGRANYNINDKYLAALSVRHDGSSRFGPDNQYATFPSVALAWRLSEEPFMKRFGGLSDLKLRASWAKTGNQSFGNYLQQATYVPSDAAAGYYFGDTLFSTIKPTGVDPNIKWESTRSYDIGVDFGFNNQRFSGAIDWYDKKTSDLLFRVPVPAGSALNNYITTNIGDMRNRGLELSLSAKVLMGGSDAKGLQWTADMTASHNTNELLSINPNAAAGTRILVGGIAGGVGSTIQVLTPGQPINSFLVYTHIRDDNGKPIYEDRNGDNVINEQDLYVDVNGDGNINASDLRPFHDPAPKWILGHSSYFNYKQFDFGFTLRAYFGGYVYNNVASNLGTYAEVGRGAPYNLHKSVLETNFLQPQYLSDYYVENADFLRMDNMTLGYTFNLRGQTARIYGIVQNVFTISDYSGVDPTAGINGIDNNIYPRSRTFTGGLSLRF